MHGTQIKLKRAWTAEDVEFYERSLCATSREDFYTYRRYITPKLKLGWWQQEVARVLMAFYKDWKAGKCPVLVLQAPPQHGKSRQVIDFISWASGHNPDLKTIYASYSDDLGLVANNTLQNIYDSPKFQRCFHDTRINTRNVLTLARRPHRNSYHMQYVGHDGEFRNTTVRGQITGMGLQLGVIDDPIKGREEAGSELIRNKTWSWFTDDFFSRFDEMAALLMIMTRWHLDDPVGRFIEHYPNAHVLAFPALGRFVDDLDDLIPGTPNGYVEGRGYWIADDVKGTPLFPEFKSKEFLLRRKKLYTIGSWMSLYQQSPIVVGGDQFPIEKFNIVDAVPSEDQIKRSVRYWDKAGTEGGTGAYTAGVLMHELTNGRFMVEDVVRGHWSALAREQRIKQTAVLDHQDDRIVKTYVEQEPGSGGKESAETTVRSLRGYRVYPDKVTGKKEIRCEPYAAQVQAGNVDVLDASWTKAFLNEHEMWPNGKYKDQVDAAGAALIKLTVMESTYDSTMRWAVDDDEDDPNG